MSSKAGVLVEVVVEWQRRQVLKESTSVVCTYTMSSQAGVLVEVVVGWQRRQVLQEGRSVVCTYTIVIKSRRVGGGSD
jgi:hypothetical protein